MDKFFPKLPQLIEVDRYISNGEDVVSSIGGNAGVNTTHAIYFNQDEESCLTSMQRKNKVPELCFLDLQAV